MGRPATQHEARKAEIVMAALDCFAKYGFEGTTNKLIAKAAGLNSAALIYHYFPSKESLFRACLYSFQVLDNMKEALEQEKGLSPEEYLTYVATTYLKVLRDPRLSKLVPMFLGTLQSHMELIPLLIERIESVLWLPISCYFQEQMKKGVMKPMTSAAALQIFLGPLVVRIISPIFMDNSIVADFEPDEVFITKLVQTFLEGTRNKAE